MLIKWTRDLTSWTILCVAVGLMTILYLSLIVDDELLLPLDDAYIHFQYARQMANGEPYQYISGDDPTSGATSLVYTPLLAIGYTIGFKGLSLAYWALLIGILAHLFSSWLIYKLLTGASDASFTALMLSLTYIFSGAMAFAALSGMETSLFIMFVIVTLFFYQRLRLRASLTSAAIVALIRPEGAVIAVLTALAVALQRRNPKDNSDRWTWVWIVLPIVMIGVQPWLNYALTGTFTANGNLAKSHLYDFSIGVDERLALISQSFFQILEQLVTGQHPIDGWYVFPLLTIPALIAAVLSWITSIKQQYVSPGFLAFLWILGLSVAIATLDTAFWHFKRYQLVMYTLLFPLAGWFILQLEVNFSIGEEIYFRGFAAIVLLTALYTFGTFATRYHDNVSVVRQQQYAMALWIDDNLLPDVRIGVHDVGMVAYVAERKTYDVVGLTTPNTAIAWRQGSGTIYETMKTHPYRPDYLAIYPDVSSLPILVEAGLFGEELTRFELELPDFIVASASGTQLVTALDWSQNDDLVDQPQTISGLPDEVLLSLNIADAENEFENRYSWEFGEAVDGFVTQVRRLPCDIACEDITDGLRVINGGESFPLPDVELGYLVVGRFHAANYAELEVGCRDGQYQSYAIPEIPGHWVEVVFILPADIPTFCIASDDAYFPAHYWVYDAAPSMLPDAPDAVIADVSIIDSTLQLTDFWVTIENDTLLFTANLYAEKRLADDGKFFIHIYDNLEAEPLLQYDFYPDDGQRFVPLANWAGGELAIEASLVVTDLPSGDYQVAFGVYDPRTLLRYRVSSDAINHDDNRLFIETITIP